MPETPGSKPRAPQRIKQNASPKREAQAPYIQ